jgi:hypothetical protein
VATSFLPRLQVIANNTSHLHHDFILCKVELSKAGWQTLFKEGLGGF